MARLAGALMAVALGLAAAEGSSMESGGSSKELPYISRAAPGRSQAPPYISQAAPGRSQELPYI